MGPNDTRFSVKHELVTLDDCPSPTPTSAEKKKIIQWLHSGTSAERDKFRQDAFNHHAPILPIPPPPPVSNQIEVIELECPPSPKRGPPTHRKEHSTTSKTSQKRPSQSQSQLQAGAGGGSTNELKNQDNVKKRKLQSQTTPPDSVEMGSVQSQSDSEPLICINIENVPEANSVVLTAEAESTKSVVQTTEVNYVPLVATNDAEGIGNEGTEEAGLEAAVSVKSECLDDTKVVEAEAHSGPVVDARMEVSAVINIESERVLDAVVIDVESEPEKTGQVDVKTEDVKTENVKAEDIKAEDIKADIKAKPVKDEATNNEYLRERHNTPPNQVATGSSLIQNPVTVDAHSPNPIFAETKILETICRLLPTSDLLTVRLLSRSWNSIAASQLQDRVQLRIDDINGKSDYKSKCQELKRVFDGHFRALPPSPLPFEQLGLHEYECQIGESNSFLCKESLQFLTIHGAHIRELNVTSFPFSHGHEHNSEGQNPSVQKMQDGCLPTEEVVMEDIKHLLIHQTPNLTSLTLDVALKNDGNNAHSGSSSGKRKPLPLLRTDPVLREIHAKFNGNPEVNTKLKVLTFPFNMTHSISAKLLEMITLLAPNLEEIVTREQDYIHFFQPFNRLPLLKSLKFGFNTLEDLELFEKIASINVAACFKDRLKLRHIRLCLPNSKFQEKNFPGFSETEIKGRVVKAISIFLECSKDSLETVEWEGLSFLPESEMWWQSLVMPKVWKLHLGNSSNVGVGQNVLPPAVGWPRLFPNLQCVSTRNIYLLLDCIKYLSLSPSNPDYFQSIKKIEIHSNNAISQENMGLIEAAFPCAKVTRKTNYSCFY